MKIKKNIPNLINGVSQQPAVLRLPTQCEEEVNGYNSINHGLTKRPPTELLQKITDQDIDDAYVCFIKRDLKEQYILIIANNDLKVFDLNGKERTVTISDTAKQYLASTNPAEHFNSITVADYTFICNKSREVRLVNKYDQGGLKPIYEKRQILKLRRVPPNHAMECEQSGNDPDWWIDYNTRISSAYHIKIDDWSVQLMARRKWLYGDSINMSRGTDGQVNFNELDEPSFDDFKDAIIQYLKVKKGLESEKGLNSIHIKTDKQLSITDHSEEWRCYYHHRDVSGVFKVYRRWSYWNNTFPYKVISSNEFKEVLVGYETEDGSVIPPETVVNEEAVIFIKLGNYACDYKILIDGVIQAEFKTADSDKNQIATNYIAKQLYNKLIANTDLMTKYEINLKKHLIKIKLKDANGDFKISTEDSLADKGMAAIKDQVNDLAELPKHCFNGFTVQIVAAGNDDTAYYVRYKERAAGTKAGEAEEERSDLEGNGIWEESKKQGMENVLMPETMPHRLVSHPDGTFTFESIPWAERHVGDLDSAPEPSFINRKINNIFFYQNRLAFLADENIIFSEDGDYYNFYPTTVRALLDGDPIDLGVTTDTVAILKQSCAYNDRLLVFADTIQFSVNHEGPLTASTVSLNIATRFDAQLKAQPVGSGTFVFFAFKRGLHSGLLEYYVDKDLKIDDAVDVSSHCPQYVSGNITHIAANTTYNTIATLTDGQLDTLYLYNYFIQDNQKVQSAWSKWIFNGDVLAIDTYENGFLVVIKREKGTYIERIDLSLFNKPVTEGFATEILLDQRALIKEGETVPVDSLQEGWVAVDQKGNTFTEKSKDKIIDNEKAALATIYIGFSYLFYYQFSEFIMHEAGTSIPNLADKVNVQTFHINYTDSANFSLAVNAKNRDSYIKRMTGRQLGESSTVLGARPLQTGTLKTAVNCDSKLVNIHVYSDGYEPCSFQTAAWSGQTRIKARSI